MNRRNRARAARSRRRYGRREAGNVGKGSGTERRGAGRFGAGTGDAAGEAYIMRIAKLLVLLLLLTGQAVHANGAGLPNFFRINNRFAITNPLQELNIPASSFLIPQDFAPDDYPVNEPITFSIDEELLGSAFSPGFIKSTQYSWDFGDGTRASGLTNTHSYAKIGSYILVLTIDITSDPAQRPTQFIDSFLLHIVPEVPYAKFPKAAITVNGQHVKQDPTTKTFKDLFYLDFRQKATFDAGGSKAGGAPIREYLWNFGDGTTGDGKTVSHLYSFDMYYATVLLRVRDADGFFTDTYIGLQNNPEAAKAEAKASGKAPDYFSPPWIAGYGIVGALVIAGILYRRRTSN
jgi:hypothetical protein